MKKTTKLLAILLAVLMAVSAFTVSIFSLVNVITEVDTSDLVMNTAWAYSGSITTTSNR